MSRALLFVLAALSGCSDMVHPKDIALAEEMCSRRGGFEHVSRYERGKNILVNCKDGAHIDVRLHEVKAAP